MQSPSLARHRGTAKTAEGNGLVSERKWQTWEHTEILRGHFLQSITALPEIAGDIWIIMVKYDPISTCRITRGLVEVSDLGEPPRWRNSRNGCN